MHSMQPSVRKASVVLQTRPDPYASGDMRRGLSLEVMEQMGLDPDPSKQAIKR